MSQQEEILKSDNVELRHILLTNFNVLLFHITEINFLFINNETEIFNLSISNFRKRISSILGSKCENYLVPIEENTSLVKLKGLFLNLNFLKGQEGINFFCK